VSYGVMASYDVLWCYGVLWHLMASYGVN